MSRRRMSKLLTCAGNRTLKIPREVFGSSGHELGARLRQLTISNGSIFLNQNRSKLGANLTVLTVFGRL